MSCCDVEGVVTVTDAYLQRGVKHGACGGKGESVVVGDGPLRSHGIAVEVGEVEGCAAAVDVLHHEWRAHFLRMDGHGVVERCVVESLECGAASKMGEGELGGVPCAVGGDV